MVSQTFLEREKDKGVCAAARRSILPVPNKMVQNSEWGPPLWRLLHTLAERLGRQTVPLLAQDEFRAWIAVLQGVEGIMPCQLCRGHYRAWRTARPLEGLFGSADASREWLWALHEDVNERRGVAADGRVTGQATPGRSALPQAEAVTFAQLGDVYGAAKRGRQEIQQDMDILLKVLGQAALERLVNGQMVREWRQKVVLLRRIMSA